MDHGVTFAVSFLCDEVGSQRDISVLPTAGDKVSTMQRFAKNFRRLSPGAQKRLTVENDDTPNSYSISDLMTLHEETGIPLVFDFHHHKFCPGRILQECKFVSGHRVACWVTLLVALKEKPSAFFCPGSQSNVHDF